MENKHLNNASELQKAGYTGLKVSCMLKAVLSVEIKQHLRLVQLDELTRINNKYFKTSYISKAEMTLLWNIFWNFVLNDYRFDTDMKLTKVTDTVPCLPKHIGMIKFNELIPEQNA
jgi:hypothetical protein